ncbi:MAG: type II secretion system protein [Phycisphaerales bacterium]|nr:type II secretion system protein [Phycisphaerales bacterium]
MTGKTRRPFRHRPLHGGFGAGPRPGRGGPSATRNPAAHGPGSSGFTLIELLVVISIFVLLLALAIPAFSSMLYSSEQALAANNLRTALSAAHDAALRSPAGLDGAAVFTFEPGGRISIIPCVQVAQLADAPQAVIGNQPAVVMRDVFVPVPTMEPVQIPMGWMVRGYAPPNSIDNEWYEQTYPVGDRTRGNWVFPETGFYDTDSGNTQDMAADGRDRQTFMVRFEGGTGRLRRGDGAAALVLLPSPAAFRTAAPFATFRADREADPARFVRRVIGAGSLTAMQKQQLLGDVSSDTVLARAVGQLAIYSATRLAGAVGARVNPDTGSIYQKPGPSNNYGPKVTNIAGQPIAGDTINRWIEGRLMVPGSNPLVPFATDARVFAMDHYMGVPQELTGSAP